MDGSRTRLNALFAADKVRRAAEEAFLDSADERTLARVITEAVREAWKLTDTEEQEGRLTRLADLCAQVPSPETIDALLAILDHPEPAVRNEAGECLLDVAYERFKEVAQGIERLLSARHSGPAMEELPFILAEIRDPDPLPIITRFLGHSSAEVAAAAIEALAGFGDPSAISHLEKLQNDKREVTLPDLDDATVSLGDLVADAIATLGGDSQDSA
jgi:HEAT repeat protein